MSKTQESRSIWVYSSLKEFLKHTRHILTQFQIREIGLANIILDEEQRRLMDGPLRKVFRTESSFEFYPEPLYLQIPGRSLGRYEAGIVDLRNEMVERYKETRYYVPIRIFSSI